MKNLKETAIANNLIVAVKPQGWALDVDEVEMPFTSTIKAISLFLGIKKNKETAVAVQVKDLRDNVLLTAKVTCHLPEDEDQAPNWSYEMSFNDDIDLENTKVYESTDLGFYEVLNKTLRSLYGFEYINNSSANAMVVSAIKVLRDWLDNNAKENEIEEVGIDGYFVASVGVENGEKVLSIVPDGACKTLIKDDSQLACE